MRQFLVLVILLVTDVPAFAITHASESNHKPLVVVNCEQILTGRARFELRRTLVSRMIDQPWTYLARENLLQRAYTELGLDPLNPTVADFENMTLTVSERPPFAKLSIHTDGQPVRAHVIFFSFSNPKIWYEFEVRQGDHNLPYNKLIETYLGVASDEWIEGGFQTLPITNGLRRYLSIESDEGQLIATLGLDVPCEMTSLYVNQKSDPIADDLVIPIRGPEGDYCRIAVLYFGRPSRRKVSP